jgi:hypothetical protein
MIIIVVKDEHYWKALFLFRDTSTKRKLTMKPKGTKFSLVIRKSGGETGNSLLGIVTEDVHCTNNFTLLIVLIADRKDVDECEKTMSIWLFTNHVCISNRGSIVDNDRRGCVLMWHDNSRRISKNMCAAVFFGCV